MILGQTLMQIYPKIGSIFDAIQHSDLRLKGAYAHKQLTDGYLEVYLIDFDRGRDIEVNGTFGNERRRTVGLRYNRLIPRLRSSIYLETNYQFGRLGDDDIRARLHVARLSYSSSASNFQSHIAAEIASGDGRLGGSVGTFNPIYDQVHPYAGILDLLGRRNLTNYHMGINMEVMSTRIIATFHWFYRESSNDAVYAPSGRILLATDYQIGKRIGQEID